jgi:hypothetical protein
VVENINMSIEQSINISGYMEKVELEFLSKLAQNKEIIIEVGVHLGRTTKLFSYYVNKLYAIDVWGDNNGFYDIFKENLKNDI